MAVFRVDKTKSYTVMFNHHLHNKKLSFKAKGLLSFMLSLPENWNYTERGLSQFAKDGRDSIRAVLLELEEEGYLIRRQSRNEDGTLAEMEYIIYEQPPPENVTKQFIENTDVLPWPENPLPVKPSSENPTIQNTNRQSTKKQNTDSQYNLSVDAVKEELKKQIGYDDLLVSNHKEIVDNILQVMLELRILSKQMDVVKIGQEMYPADLIRMKISQLTYFHIGYITECMKNHKGKIRNIKAYLQKSILNAPDTMDAFYEAEARHDLYHKRE